MSRLLSAFRIHMSKPTADLLMETGDFAVERRGVIQVKVGLHYCILSA